MSISAMSQRLSLSRLPGPLSAAFCVIGAATTCLWTLRLAQNLIAYLRPSTLPRFNPDGKDAWALVTGASDGIGFGFAQELSKRGFNVFLHGRNSEKLARRQEELQAEFPTTKYRIIVSDASNVSENIDSMATVVGDAPLTVLVNNVGGESRPYRGLAELTYEDTRNTIHTNAMFMAQVTRALLPVLEKNGPSLVLNISSVASYGIPFVPVYSGTKGFVDSFTYSLRGEMRADKKNVEVQCVRVGNVQSAGNDAEIGMATPDSRSMAAGALNRVGSGALVIGHWRHLLPVASVDLFPRSLLTPHMVQTMRELRKKDDAKAKNA